MMSLIALACEQPDLQQRAHALAEELAIPYRQLDDAAFDFWLILTPERLELRSRLSGQATAVYADFTSGKAAYRRRFGGGRSQPLARAVGLKHGLNPTVLDATAGLGRDAFVLAALGCRVRLMERSTLIAALLHDALVRARNDPEVGDWIGERMQLQTADSRQAMERITEADRPEVVYLDPMYPAREKSALVKKELRLLRHLLGADEDASGLLEAALRCARRRVVVKRPRGAPCLSEVKPHHMVTAPNTRFDVYLPQH